MLQSFSIDSQPPRFAKSESEASEKYNGPSRPVITHLLGRLASACDGKRQGIKNGVNDQGGVLRAINDNVRRRLIQSFTLIQHLLHLFGDRFAGQRRTLILQRGCLQTMRKR